MRVARAFSLLETLIGLGILMLLMLILFEVLKMGFTHFQLGATRTGLQSEINRCLTSLERELQQSSIYTAAGSPAGARDLTLPSGTTVPRDGLCFAFVDDPGNEANFDAGNGLPRWNAYTIYFATDELPTGRLIRYQVHSVFAGLSQVPLTDFQLNSNSYFNLSAMPSSYITGTLKTLSKNVYAFGAVCDTGKQCVDFQIGFQADEGRITMGNKSTAEIVTTNTTIYPQNTYPKL